MFGRLRLKQRMYLQLFLAVLPLAVVFFFQMTSTSDLPEQVDKTLGIYDLCLRASTSYKNFLNGVSDAVDTGSFSNKALHSLNESKSLVDSLITASPSDGIKHAGESLAKIHAAISANNSIGSLTPLKAEVNSIDKNLEAQIVEIKTQLSNLVIADTKATREKNQISVFVALITLLLLAFIIRQMVNGITNPISLAVNAAQHVSKGDLTSHIEVSRKDEIGKLQQALFDMNEALIVIVDEVRKSSQEIITGTKEMASGNSDLSSRTEEQAINLEKTAASLEQLSSVVTNNADNSRQASVYAQNSSDAAVKGGEIVGKVIDTMELINKSSSDVVEIITVIEGIAFQTNILALNAAVEAARAGEQGKGFAVVASEVRNLAQRTSASAKNIKSMIESSASKVSDGTKLVKQAGAAMKDIVASVDRVTKMMAEIQEASAEQKVGILQVSDAVQQMNQVTQQNAALVEEAAAIASSVFEQTKNLTAAVEKFKIPGVEHGRDERQNDFLALP